MKAVIVSLKENVSIQPTTILIGLTENFNHQSAQSIHRIWWRNSSLEPHLMLLILSIHQCMLGVPVLQYCPIARKTPTLAVFMVQLLKVSNDHLKVIWVCKGVDCLVSYTCRPNFTYQTTKSTTFLSVCNQHKIISYW